YPGTNTTTNDFGNNTLNNVTTDSLDTYTGHVYEIVGTLDIEGTLHFKLGAVVNTGMIALSGNLITEGTTLSGTGVIELDGATNQYINSGGESGMVSLLVVNKSSGIADASSATSLGTRYF